MKTKFEKMNDELFAPLNTDEMAKVRGGLASSTCTTMVLTGTVGSPDVKSDGTEQIRRPYLVPE